MTLQVSVQKYVANVCLHMLIREAMNLADVSLRKRESLLACTWAVSVSVGLLMQCSCSRHVQMSATQHFHIPSSSHGNILFARMVKLCQAPVYEAQLLLLMIYHHLPRHSQFQSRPTDPP